ncbi:hypothetical protein BTN50_0860 [Candidatus Enterovibrio altilux]|uniref:Uncharacterized protein n=1 Tax=Candidatus Enterovibrio altilux TaxID=1927128 RepID=A0A291B8S2_9GAMM|nr:hypothetical protein BTN50_0860 [Candidatus Enterovibrio luxaltus]
MTVEQVCKQNELINPCKFFNGIVNTHLIMRVVVMAKSLNKLDLPLLLGLV